MNIAGETRAHRAAMHAQLAVLARHSWLVANARLAVFVAAAGLGVAALLGKVGPWAPYGVVAGVLAYVALIFLHRSVDDRERRGRAAVAYDDRLLARASGTWQKAPRDGKGYAAATHPYARDLDIFGHASLFQLLNETPTRSGEERLAAWLAAPADIATILTRQRAVKALAPRLGFRRELSVAAAADGDDKVDPSALARWATDSSVSLASIAWARWLPFVLVPVTL